MNDILYSQHRRTSKHPRFRAIAGEWMSNVGIWIIGLMVAYALVGMSS